MAIISLFWDISLIKCAKTKLANINAKNNVEADGKNIKELIKELINISWSLDFPAVIVIALAIGFSQLCLHLLPEIMYEINSKPTYPIRDIFVYGVSSGAIAVEIIFANFVYLANLRADSN